MRFWLAARQQAPKVTEAEVRDSLYRLGRLWEELFPAEQARIARALVERVTVGPVGAETTAMQPQQGFGLDDLDFLKGQDDQGRLYARTFPETRRWCVLVPNKQDQVIDKRNVMTWNRLHRIRLHLNVGTSDGVRSQRPSANANCIFKARGELQVDAQLSIEILPQFLRSPKLEEAWPG